MTYIADLAFTACEKLEAVDMRNVEEIRMKGFIDCCNLRHIAVNLDVTLGDNAFVNVCQNSDGSYGTLTVYYNGCSGTEPHAASTDEEKKFVIPILKSSRKGLIVHNTRTAWEHIEEFDKQGNKWRKEVRPYGVFKRNESQKGALSFQLTAPKIPGEFLDQIVIRFRKDPSKEAAFQIFYDIETQEYELYEPVQKRSKTSVHFIRNHRLETEKTLMMDIHSHGMMEAFFSGIDDRDEKGVQLYMVLGNLNCSSPSLKLRAGMAGHFLNLSLHDVFEEGSAI